MKLGKRPARRDPRTLRFASLLRRAKLPTIPSSYTDPAAIPTPMFGNDQYGDCVIAARAHATLRYEFREQGLIVPIGTEEAVWEYLNESGGQDKGLWLIDSLKCWRKWGWTGGGRQYKCHSFAQVEPCATELVQAAIFLLGPIQAGFTLPYSVTRNMESDEPWSIVQGPECAADPDGGHAVAIVGYDQDGLIGITWARRQRIGYDFWEAYADEAYAVVDERDPWLGADSPVDIEAGESYLQQVAAAA